MPVKPDISFKKTLPESTVQPLTPELWNGVNDALQWETTLARTSRPYQQWMCEHSHLHAYAEIVVCLKGSHFYGINGQAFAMEPGSVALIPGNVPHDSWYSVHHRECLDLWLHFLPHGHVILNTVHHEPSKGTHLISLNVPDPSLLGDFKRAFSLINQLPSNDSSSSKKTTAFILYTMHSLLEKLAEGSFVRASSDEITIIENIKEYAINHLSDRLTLDELARVAGFSPFHFHRIFSRSEGVTPRHFIETNRIQHACQLLKDGQSVTSAAFDSGFATCSQFDRVFKKHLKVSPSNWLKPKSKT